MTFIIICENDCLQTAVCISAYKWMHEAVSFMLFNGLQIYNLFKMVTNYFKGLPHAIRRHSQRLASFSYRIQFRLVNISIDPRIRLSRGSFWTEAKLAASRGL